MGEAGLVALDADAGADERRPAASEPLLALDALIAERVKSISPSQMMWLVALFAAIGGLLFGYDIGVISGALLFIKQDFALDSALEGVVVSFVLVGGIVGVAAAGYLSDAKGRRPTIAYSGVFFAGGALVMAVCPTGATWLLVTGRFIVGLGIGLSTMTIPLYIAELAPASKRGRLVAADELFIVVGIFVSFLVNWALKFLDVNQPWRWSFGLSIIFALVLIFGVYFLPESPRWLLAQQRGDEAARVLRRVRDTDDEVRDEIEAIRKALDEGGFTTSWRASFPLLVSREYRTALAYSVVLALLVQFTGQPTLLYYSAKVIESTQAFGSSSALFGISAVPVAVKLIATAASTFLLVDRVGRRWPLMIGMAVMALVLFALAASAVVSGSIDGVAVVIGLSVYVAAFAVGLGPGCFVVFSEIFPPHLRAVGQSISIGSMLFFNLVVSLTFLSLANLIGYAGVFALYGLVAVGGVAFVFFLLPETNGKSLEDSAGLFRRG